MAVTSPIELQSSSIHSITVPVINSSDPLEPAYKYDSEVELQNSFALLTTDNVEVPEEALNVELKNVDLLVSNRPKATVSKVKVPQ